MITRHLAPGRAAAGALLLILAVGSLAMWIAVPALWIWVITLFADDYLAIYGLALIGCPVTMGLFLYGLVRVNEAYEHLAALPPRQPQQTGWLRAYSGERRSTHRRPVLDRLMVFSVIVAVTVLMTYFFFFAGSSVAPYN